MREENEAPHVALLHGYRIESDITLHTAPAPDGVADHLPWLRLRRGNDRKVPWEAPEGDELARIEDVERRVFYAVSRNEQGVTLRFYGACEFVADPGLREVVAHVDPGIDPGVVPVLVSGTLLAVRLMLDGHLVLHASAVDVGGRAVAFVGASGMGKSTMATLLCAAGLGLVSDDVLRVARPSDGAPPHVWPGASETRLRTSALELESHFQEATGSRTTADGRTAIGAPELRREPLPLAAVVVPLPSRSLTDPEVVRLEPMAALTSLIRFPRVLGWTDTATMAEQFDQLSYLVQIVPVYLARLPWGPPFSPTLAPRMLQLLDL